MNIELAKQALKKFFGYDAFRPMQDDIIQAVFDKKDSLVLMPTGGGKSICFQIPAITMDGVCIVISPLIALMKDQVEALRANGVSAAFLNSSLTSKEQQQIEDDLFNGHIKLLYVSPEKLVSSSFFSLLKTLKINLFAIDEAHCISSWGHDFRPEYNQLKFLKRHFKNIPIIALTATADKLTRQDIIEQLQLQNPKIFLASFDRPNLSLSVRPAQKRLEKIVDFIKKRPNESGIIYCLSRKSTEQLATKLNKFNINASFYHAKLSSQQRSNIQEAFINDNLQIVVATIAFGMGIDKSNVRWVIHYNMPKNIESYYQEIGRAGRDGAPADTLLFYSFADVMILRNIIEDNESDQQEIKLAKLERMQQYADTLMCRRKILLHYFNENTTENCGNCDVCKNPPTYFDGTIIAQKALSAIYRLKESVGINMLIDVLRGSKRRDIFDKGYHNIKTYGLGAEYSFGDWQQFLQQMLNIGLLEIAYDKHNWLQLTPLSHQVLFQNKKVQLVKMVEIHKHREAQKEVKKPKAEIIRDELFEVLRQLRKQIALQTGVPPYVVFADTTLGELSQKRPIVLEELKSISGIGEVKIQRYGLAFIQAIRTYLLKKIEAGERIKGGTYLKTLALYEKGHTIQEIADIRNLNTETITGHFIYWYSKDEDIDLKQFIEPKDVEKIHQAIKDIPEDDVTYSLVYEYFKEEVSYSTIKLAFALLPEEEKSKF